MTLNQQAVTRHYNFMAKKLSMILYMYCSLSVKLIRKNLKYETLCSQPNHDSKTALKLLYCKYGEQTF